ncbi:hypothetical protein KX816_12170 [Sphingosinicellaceae bacterium]|nr:hypothetical protein KX816_12170 [Sphingosinicellaceae bacterium]
MAYLQFNEIGNASNAVGVRAPRPVEVYSFSQLEWTVVRVARLDASRWKFHSRLLDRLLRMLLGDVRDDGLANPRLEALRRTALAIRRRGARVPGDVIAAFHAAGFTREQLTTLIHSVELDIVSRRQGRLA